MFLIHKLLNMTYIYFPEISRMEDTIEKLRPYFNYISDNWLAAASENKSLSIPKVQELVWKNWLKVKKTENSVGTKKGKKVKKTFLS